MILGKMILGSRDYLCKTTGYYTMLLTQGYFLSLFVVKVNTVVLFFDKKLT